MLKRFAVITALLALVFSQKSCVKNNNDPAWIEVSAWELENNPSGIYVGELTHAFTNASVYVDDKFIGIFEMPFKTPILEEGSKKITRYPTILNNGISATKKIYPFVESFEIDVELVKNQNTEIQPVTRYKSNTILTILDFEGNIPLTGNPQLMDSSSDSNIIEWFNGNQFGKVELTTANSI